MKKGKLFLWLFLCFFQAIFYYNGNVITIKILFRFHCLHCKLVEEGNACDSVQQLMYISEFSDDTNFGLALFLFDV